MFRSAKTFILLAGLTGLLLLVGSALDAGSGGSTFTTLMLLVSIGMNLVAYFKGKDMALRSARAVPIDGSTPDGARVARIVAELAAEVGQPVPELYISPSPQLNAFATGRNPDNAAVCVNEGLLRALDDRELRGVLGHELQHVYNRDILIGTVAGVIAALIGYLAFVARFAAMFGGGRDEDRNPLALMAVAFVAPIAATVIQLAVTRSRESLADDTGAELTGDPLGLAMALRKLEAGANDPRLLRAGGVPSETTNAYAHLYIAAPFGGRAAFAKLFSSHPPISERIARLEERARQLGDPGAPVNPYLDGGPSWPTG